MKDNQAKYPQLRFKGFTDPWEERKLEDISEIIDGDRGKNYPSGDDFKNNGHTLFLSAANVTKQGFVFKETQYITKLKSESLGSGKVILNDIILTSRGSIGHIGFYDKKTHEYIPQARINSGMLILRTDKLNSPSFIAQFLKSPWGIKQIKLISFGSAQPQLTKKDIKNFKIILPKMEEQQKIGSFFKQLDDTIALHQRKLAKFKELKQGYLQKMFPQNGSKFPQLRFAGFADAWEQRKLGDITKISTGKLDANAMVENGKYDFYTSGIKKYRIDVAAFEGPSITIAGNGATVGYMHLADNKFNAYQRTYVLQEFLVDRSFMFSEIGNKLPKKIKQEARTGNIPYIVMDMLTELKLSIPQNNSEQQKIGSFFKQLDDTIDLHQRKLEKLQELKKGYLQKMFC